MAVLSKLRISQLCGVNIATRRVTCGMEKSKTFLLFWLICVSHVTLWQPCIQLLKMLCKTFLLYFFKEGFKDVKIMVCQNNIS